MADSDWSVLDVRPFAGDRVRLVVIYWNRPRVLSVAPQAVDEVAGVSGMTGTARVDYVRANPVRFVQAGLRKLTSGNPAAEFIRVDSL